MRQVITAPARIDLLRLNAFLAEKSPAAARKAMDAIDAALRGLADWPMRGSDAGSGFRHLPIRFGDSGYLAVYRIDPDAVVIARIFHMREDR